MVVKENRMLIVSKCWLARWVEFITHLQLEEPCKFRWPVANEAPGLVKSDRLLPWLSSDLSWWLSSSF